MLGKQKGISMIGFLFACACVVVIGIIAMKVIPVYINHYAIIRSMKDLNHMPKAELQRSPQMGRAYLKEYLSRKLYINEIRFITKKQIKVKRKRKVFVISVPYTIEEKLLGNVSLIFKFNPSYEVTIEAN